MKTRFFALAMLALALAACNNDNENLNDGPVAAQFIADITPATPSIRKEPTGPTATASASPAQASPTCPTRERTVSS